MNNLMCFLTGGHKYFDANMRTETAADDNNIVILTNPCVKCGDLSVVYMKVGKCIEKELRKKEV